MPTAFLLKGKIRVCSDAHEPAPFQVYDPVQQIWIDTLRNKPVVLMASQEVSSSQFGETIQTATKEGVDQESLKRSFMSNFGETSITKTSGEGVDHTSEVLHASQFGETSITETSEGIDSSESISNYNNATNSYF